MKASNNQYDLAKALSAALEPLIDVCLEIGVTSPELESLLQATFVQRAFVRVPGHSRTGEPPSAVRVSIATGVHRAKVSKMRAEGGVSGAAPSMHTQKRQHSKAERVLKGWTSDPRFMTSGGHPLDLPFERNKQRRSFEDLTKKYAPGVFPSSVLKELRRLGQVNVSDDKIVRFVSETPQPTGLTEASVAKAAKRMKRLGNTLFENVAGSRHHVYDETSQITINAKQLALLRPILMSRIKMFLAALENEMRARSELGVQDSGAEQVGVSVFSWEEE